MSRTFVRALGLPLASIAILSTVTVAQAQIRAPASDNTYVGGGSSRVDEKGSASAQRSATAAPSGARTPSYVFLDQLPEYTPDASGKLHLKTPLSPAYQSFRRDTPAMRYEDCLASYGENACTRLAASNMDVCMAASEIAGNLPLVDKTLATVDDAEQLLMGVYQDLPGEVKRTTRVMQIGQVAQAGFLCAITLGNYCIAVAIGAAGNIFSAETNKNLQIANIRLSILNIVATRANTRLQQIFVRAMGVWIKFAAPACTKGGYTQIMALDALPAYNNPIPDFVWGKNGRPAR